MEKTIIVNGLNKTFKLSKKQMKIDKTDVSYKVAVKDLSFETYRGEIFGLLGPNGAGKTTTLRMLATLITPDSGSAEILGINISDESVKNNIGFLTNELKLEDNFTPNYLFNYFAGFRNMTDEQIEKRKDELFKKFGVDKFSEVKVADLSTGMKQKLMIVLSIIHDPEVIIFDEPTLGLDVLTAKVVTDFILELKESGKTVIISSHIFPLIEKICDRVGIIIDGQLVACDTLENIKKMSTINDLEDVFFNLYKEKHGGEE